MANTNIPNNTQLKLNNNVSTKRAKQTHANRTKIINALTDALKTDQRNIHLNLTAYNVLYLQAGGKRKAPNDDLGINGKTPRYK